MGYDAASVTKYRNAAAVYRHFINCNGATNKETINCNEQLLAKTNHQNEIHKADPSCWFILTTLMLEKGWTVKETSAAVSQFVAAYIVFLNYRVQSTELSEKARVQLKSRGKPPSSPGSTVTEPPAVALAALRSSWSPILGKRPCKPLISKARWRRAVGIEDPIPRWLGPD